ncbi:Lysosomal Pro-X carboxypeptidase [Morus notabilis]|uniref:Lysosomal Pro-X carboxypeptidase n=1 Tax=Morus notabilis TaxID=981085 RepID=W9R4Z7_9ROSA|nr:Lysosomal Pro-X carboxypeptidase [Morus notabilis]
MIGFKFLSLFLLCLLSSAFSIPIKAPNKFPSSLISPEKISLLSTTQNNKLYRTSYFTQTLDHFNFYPKSYQTFQQRYLINDTFWGGATANAPIFVYTGNEGDIEWFTQNTGFMFEIAPHFKALLVFLESESESCYKVIKGSWKQIKDTANKPGGAKLLRKAFKLCEDYEYIADYLENWLSTAYIYTSMTDYPTPSNFLNPLPAYPIKQMCKAIDNPTTGNDTFAKLYGAANIYYNYTGTAKCFDLDDDSDPHGLSGWGWQACTEMILPTSGNTKESIFPASEWHYSGRVSYCKNVYGVEPRRNWITTEFGGFGIERVLKRFGSNIIFFNGLRDPWSGGGVLKNISRSIVAIVAKEGAHHVDLRFSTKEDPEWLKEVRKQEINIIAGWISQYYHDLAHLTS